MKVYRFEVHGKYPFPIDMLRYDSCYPADPTAVGRMAEAIVGPAPDMPFRDRPIFNVRLLSHRAPTVDRWRSFGWFVEGLEERKVS